jgi:phage terminase small subunit
MSKKLTPKQRKFCEEYVTTGNGSEAYRRAYDVGVNTKIETIKVKASHLLAQDNISTTIAELQEKQAKHFEITRSDVAKGYLEIIQAWRSLMQLASKEELTKDEKQKFYLLKEMVKGSDYRGAYDSLAKMFGLNEPDKTQIDQTIREIQVVINRNGRTDH